MQYHAILYLWHLSATIVDSRRRHVHLVRFGRVIDYGLFELLGTVLLDVNCGHFLFVSVGSGLRLLPYLLLLLDACQERRALLLRCRNNGRLVNQLHLLRLDYLVDRVANLPHASAHLFASLRLHRWLHHLLGVVSHFVDGLGTASTRGCALRTGTS